MSEESVLKDTEPTKPKKKFEFPHVFAILFALIIITAVLSYVIPAGEYEREVNEAGETVVVDGTYHTVDSNPVGFLGIFEAVHKGMVEGAGIIFFIFIVGGAFGILNATKAIEAGFASISARMAGKEIYLIPVVMVLFALGGGTFGMSEETIPFILILVPLAIKMGFDSLVGAGMVIVGSCAGFTAAFMNPFTVGVAQGIAELPLFSGMGFRFIVWFIFVAISIAYVMIYANKVRKRPEISMMYQVDQQRDVDLSIQKQQQKLNLRQSLIIGALILTIIGLAIGVTFFDWYIMEIAGLFLLMGVIVGFIGKLRVNQIAEAFVKGSEDLVVGGLVVGLAYGILVVLEDSNTIDSILFFVSNLVGQLPTSFSAMGMYITQSLLNFIVPSGSGQAALTMPIMTPLADLTGVSRQTAVFAFQLGDGISNAITPTAGVLMASLAIAKIPWVKWLKWFWPLIVIHYVVGAVLVTFAHLFVW
ncbi:putative basic amino acid antiporter YfcC [Virgibacillus dakarensis]|uniref:YfcC family protein n=1 Tax=Virgibacillus dakarensis TaxID=1917889 RepID=UPI000B450CC9|nr:YfcC family protein [Virgibacillus dakarensis]MBT2215467.1 YfcC family protein [Virgibacillus dakarensis]MTW86245.1 putative basic amino acid antiporter YfcC [Virgibacillus dakarensis]